MRNGPAHTPDTFWIVVGTDPMDKEREVAGPFSDSQKAREAAEMLVHMGYSPDD